LSISVENARVAELGLAAEALQNACRSLAAGRPAWAEAHLAAWADIFRKFGAKVLEPD
jgi:DNA/RNA-binding domain of Phe-tRNA-synthetase-like protein